MAGVVGAHIGAARHVLAEGPVLDPDDLTFHRGLGELLRIIGMVQELFTVLGRDFQAVGGARAQSRGVFACEGAVRAIGIPTDEAVRICLTIVLVSQYDIFIFID